MDKINIRGLSLPINPCPSNTFVDHIEAENFEFKNLNSSHRKAMIKSWFQIDSAAKISSMLKSQY